MKVAISPCVENERLSLGKTEYFQRSAESLAQSDQECQLSHKRAHRVEATTKRRSRATVYADEGAAFAGGHVDEVASAVGGCDDAVLSLAAYVS